MSRIIEGFDNYEVGEIAYVIELLAAMCTPEEIKDKFFSFTEPGKVISHKTIQKIAMRYSKQISERNAIYLKNLNGNPLSHRRVRLDVLQRIIKECLTSRPSHSIRVGDDYEMVMKADHGNAISALKLVLQEMDKQEEVRALEKQVGLGEEDEEDEDDGYEADNGLGRFTKKA